MCKIFKSIRKRIMSKRIRPITRFGFVPFVDESKLRFQQEGLEYAEKWAQKQAGEYHPKTVSKIGRWYKLLVYLSALLPAVLPSAWMKFTHPDDYLNTPLYSVKISAFLAGILIYVMTTKLTLFGFAVWSDFVMIRCHLLALLYICSTEAGRRYVFRMWEPD